MEGTLSPSPRVSESPPGCFSAVALPQNADVSCGDVPRTSQGRHALLGSTTTHRHTPCVGSLLPPLTTEEEADGKELEEEEVLVEVTTARVAASDFTERRFQPKLQVALTQPPGDCPRRLQVERRRREFQSQRLESLLSEAGVEATTPLLPVAPRAVYRAMRRAGSHGYPPFLPLEVFDDEEEFECRTPEEWLSLGLDSESGIRKPVPARAFLPMDEKSKSAMSWVSVGMLDYDHSTRLYLVQRADANGRVCLALKGDPPYRGAWLPRVLVAFHAEDPRRFAARVARAVSCRRDAEAALLHSLALDCVPSPPSPPSPPLLPTAAGVGVAAEGGGLDREMWARVKTRVGALMGRAGLECCVERLWLEVSVQHAGALRRLQYERLVAASPHRFPFICTPAAPPEPVAPLAHVAGRVHDLPPFPFAERLAAFRFRSLLTHGAALRALCCTSVECGRLSTSSASSTSSTSSVCLFHISAGGKPQRLADFRQMQAQTQAQVQLFLCDSWLPSLAQALRGALLGVAAAAALDPRERRWDSYRRSKLRRLLEAVRLRMEHALRRLALKSVGAFVQTLLDACQRADGSGTSGAVGATNAAVDNAASASGATDAPRSDAGVADVTDAGEGTGTLAWGPDLINSPYKPRRGPLFVVDLVMDSVGVHFSTPLELFEPTIVELFDSGIRATHNVPQLEKLVLQDMFFSGTPLLESVGLHEPAVEELRSTLAACVRSALVPARAYADALRPFLDLHNADPEQHAREHVLEVSDVESVRAELRRLRAELRRVEASLPPAIVVGPLWVSVEELRRQLARRCQALATATLAALARTLRRQADAACEEFQAIDRKIHERPSSIEELSEQRQWMQGVPLLLKDVHDRFITTTPAYDLLEEFRHSLSNEDFNARWSALGWPLRATGRLQEVQQKQQVEQEERFRAVQQHDLNAFHERLDSLQMAVAGFSAHTEASRAHETANEARRLAKQLRECQQLAQLYNSRQRLLGQPLTNYDKLGTVAREFQPLCDLWTTVSSWQRWRQAWLYDPLASIDAEQMERSVGEAHRTVLKCAKALRAVPGCHEVALEVRAEIEEFRPLVPLLRALRGPGLRGRHWEELSARVGVTVRPRAELTFTRCLEMGLQQHVDAIAAVADVAEKEFAIEQALERMESEWSLLALEVAPYRSTGTFLLKSPEEAMQTLEEHIMATQAMAFSPHRGPCEGRIATWEAKLRLTQDVLDEWLACQRSWLYLEPIFSSEDINRQLPLEGKRYQTMERAWRRIMKGAHDKPQVMSLCPDARLLEQLRECSRLLEQVQKGLSEYLETKRAAFPRFYFLSDDELLEILSQSKDPTAVQPHLRKCFENIASLVFQKELLITHMVSAEGECVELVRPLVPRGNVEDWLLEVELAMKDSVRDGVARSLAAYPSTPRASWVLKWPGQIVIAGCQTFWTQEVTRSIEAGELSSRLTPLLAGQLGELVALVRGELTRAQRAVLSALIVVEVHAQDVVGALVREDVTSTNDFEWISQLRYYWTQEDLFVRAVNAEFLYGYEYLGNSGRLVITPLTDRCYLTLTGALHLKFGGAPAGPAGTGKTETTKDLGKALAVQTVVFNCSDQLDYLAMGKFLKGLASAGAWACFDEFNRIDVEVLSVVAQQITTIQKAQQQRVSRFMFEGVEIPLVPSCAVFITMNPGYAGRTELPDNLKALFRPVAMMVPDYSMIARISLLSFGFDEAELLAKKITTTFKLASEQLSSQDHYDFGMRAVKTVISTAGNLKREQPHMDEELLCLRALRDANVPKFLDEDLALFEGIVSDLFPRTRRGHDPAPCPAPSPDPAPDPRGGALEGALRAACLSRGLQDEDGFIRKCRQLYDTTLVRHGLMLVGLTGTGKTQCYRVLADALMALRGQQALSGGSYQGVNLHVLNPKAISMGQLYGEFDLLTHEWTDGILSSLIRSGVAADSSVAGSGGGGGRFWYVLDGPVDAVWIENMNTVLDDNKKLCLSSGEIIKLTESQTMMFEVQDLSVASPATVSRCGMVYLGPRTLGLTALTEAWLARLTGPAAALAPALRSLFQRLLPDAVSWVRATAVEPVPSVDVNLAAGLLNILDCFLQPLKVAGGVDMGTARRAQPRRQHRQEEEEAVVVPPVLLEAWAVFALVWSVGASCDAGSRPRFNRWLRDKMAAEELCLPFPDEGLVYDYRLDDGGFSGGGRDDVEEEGGVEASGRQVRWVGWMVGVAEFTVAPGTPFTDIVVPTVDTLRMSHLLHLLLTNHKPVLCVGPTGTGKSLTLSSLLLNEMPASFVTHFLNFSARTTAAQTQEFVDSKTDKRRKGVFGPPLGQRLVLCVEDVNLPALDAYGAQPPLELLRQCLDQGGWYDVKRIGEFRQLVDTTVVGTMGPPGGGRNAVSPRFLRHFHLLSFPELDDGSRSTIFATILNSWTQSEPALRDATERLVASTLAVYAAVSAQLLPTPARCHYTFNLRDLSRLFQGILMADAARVKDVPALLGLWHHECCRVFGDRLVNDVDRSWLAGQLERRITGDFGVGLEAAVPSEPHLYGDFAAPGGERSYQLMPDYQRVLRVIQEAMEEYSASRAVPAPLVLFEAAVCHLCRVARVLRQPLGSALLLGVGGSGRQSLARLAAHLCEYECVQIELTKSYGVTEWRQDLQRVMMKAGVDNIHVAFLLTDTQITSESFLEDVNSLLNSGDVPGVLGPEQTDSVLAAMQPLVLQQGLAPSKSNLLATFARRVRCNLHVVLCMSPVGEVFRARLRRFPSLVNCCTIDWFSEWPHSALAAVASSHLTEMEAGVPGDQLQGLVRACVRIHQSLSEASLRFRAQLGRATSVTATAFLELLATFGRLLALKSGEIRGARTRMQGGLDKLLQTAQDVAGLQQELEAMKPQLLEAARETELTMKKITAEVALAEETRRSVSEEQRKASASAAVAQAMADDAERDLAQALPALEAALGSLKALNKNDVTEVRAMQRPPPGVRMVMEAVCIMKGVKPRKVAGDKPGTRVDDYWEGGRGLLQEPGRFIDGLLNYDKDNIPEAVIRQVQPFIDTEDFQPAAIERVSKACTTICLWVRAMHQYHHVARAVLPKREARRVALEELEVTQAALSEAQQRLQEVEAGVAHLQLSHAEATERREFLQTRSAQCEGRLERAAQLIGGLADERVRWSEAIKDLDCALTSIVGDALLAAGFVTYLGPFTAEYRASLTCEWLAMMTDLGVPHTATFSFVKLLGDQILIRSAQMSGLPRDQLSVENSVIVQHSRRWPLFIDPQGQANRWIKNTESEQGLVVLKLSDRDFLRSIETAVRFGKPCLVDHVGDQLDPALDPILLRQTFSLQGGGVVIRVGDALVPYHDHFRLFLCTALPNPHYSAEVTAKVTLLNFTLSPSGLEDQLLGRVVAVERPDLEEARAQLMTSSAQMVQELRGLEEEILRRLSGSQGNPVDDVELIAALHASKGKAAEIQAKVVRAAATERELESARARYLPVAQRGQLLFFCTTALATVEAMYQHSLGWYVGIFTSAIASAPQADSVELRVGAIVAHLTLALYRSVCRSLFERHRLLFSFLVCSRILSTEREAGVEQDEWRFLLSGGAVPAPELPNPAPLWLPERAWGEIQALSALPRFSSLAGDFGVLAGHFQAVFDSPEPHRAPLPEPWSSRLNPFQRLLLLRCLRSDALSSAMLALVAQSLGPEFIEPMVADLSSVFADSSPSVPVVLLLSPGTDPASALAAYAEERRFSKKLSAISLGQGQGPRAEALMRLSMERGRWLFLQNCHLAPSWMPTLEALVSSIEPDKVHRDFCLCLTSLPSPHFPVSVLQNSSKMALEPPRGVRNSLVKSFTGIGEEFVSSCAKPTELKSLLLALCLFHGVSLERRRYGPLGFNVPYEFTEGDLSICVSQLHMFLGEYNSVPFKVLRYTAGQINYGGRVTDDWDRRTLWELLSHFYRPESLDPNHSYTECGTYRQIASSTELSGYLQYARSLPLADSPAVFGLHPNASLTLAHSEGVALLVALLQMQPQEAAAGGVAKSRDEVVEEMARHVLSEVPEPLAERELMEKFPVRYDESMNSVLVQEALRYNRLLGAVRCSLQALLQALQGLVVMSSELELMAHSLYTNAVPALWQAKAYPSLKPLAPWLSELSRRVDFVRRWAASDGPPASFWIGGLFFPQAFLTGTLQNHARRSGTAIDALSFTFQVMRESAEALVRPPPDGCFVWGLFLEGARWDAPSGLLAESLPRQLHTAMAVLWLRPSDHRQQRQQRQQGGVGGEDGDAEARVYRCPVYKTLARAGTLSTTGHSTNFVLAVDLPSDRGQSHWVKRGAALLCALDY